MKIIKWVNTVIWKQVGDYLSDDVEFFCKKYDLLESWMNENNWLGQENSTISNFQSEERV